MGAREEGCVISAGSSRVRLLGPWLVALGLVAGFALGCVVADPAYCERDEQCGAGPSSADPAGRRGCHPIRHICMELAAGGCFLDTDCTDPARPRCDQVSATCTACRPGDPSDTSCAHLTPDGNVRCTAGPSGEGRCTECSRSLDCPADRPICDGTTSRCRACARHSDCEGELVCENGARCTDSLVCIREGDLPEGHAGRCAHNEGATGRVVYATYDPEPTACAMQDNNGGTSAATAVCDLHVAIDKAVKAGARYVRLFGSADFNANGSTLGPGALSIIGAPRAGESKNVRVLARGTLVEAKVGSDVTLDQVDVCEISINGTPLSCAGGTTAAEATRLRLLGCTISGNTQLADVPTPTSSGLRSENCSLFIDQSVLGTRTKADVAVAGAHAYGLLLYESTGRKDPLSIVVQNSVIAGNLLGGILLEGRGDSSSVFRFNTIYGNGRTGRKEAGGVMCPVGAAAAPRRFENNILFANQTDAAGSQLLSPGTCTFFNNVVGQSESYKPAEADAFRYRDFDADAKLGFSAAATNRECCIDQAATSGSSTLPAYDIDGTARPQPRGGRADVGAVEAY